MTRVSVNIISCYGGTMRSEKTKNERQWEKMINQFSEIPESRKLASPENLRWFLRNGAVLIHNHPEASNAVYFAQRALDGQ